MSIEKTDKPLKRTIQDNKLLAQSLSEQAMHLTVIELERKGIVYPYASPDKTPIQNFDALQAYIAHEQAVYHKNLKLLTTAKPEAAKVVMFVPAKKKVNDYHDRY